MLIGNGECTCPVCVLHSLYFRDLSTFLPSQRGKVKLNLIPYWNAAPLLMIDKNWRCLCGAFNPLSFSWLPSLSESAWTLESGHICSCWARRVRWVFLPDTNIPLWNKESFSWGSPRFSNISRNLLLFCPPWLCAHTHTQFFFLSFLSSIFSSSSSSPPSTTHSLSLLPSICPFVCLVEPRLVLNYLTDYPAHPVASTSWVLGLCMWPGFMWSQGMPPRALHMLCSDWTTSSAPLLHIILPGCL